MDNFNVFPDKCITENRPVSKAFIDLGITSLQEACRYVHELPYGYNLNSDNLMILLKEKKGTCTTKHAVIGTLAQELSLPVHKNVGIYAMTEEIVSGTNTLLAEFQLPYIPMLHCFLVYENFRVDLTDGNSNGKNRSIEAFLYVQQVTPNISDKGRIPALPESADRCCFKALRAFRGRSQTYPSRPGRRAQTLEGEHSLTPRPYKIKIPVGSLARIQQVEEGCFVLHLRFYNEPFLHSL